MAKNKMTDLVALTNAMTDIIVKVSYEELDNLGLKMGFHNRKTNISYIEFLQMISKKETLYIQGGSPANVIFTAAKLGLETALLGTVGNDSYGIKYLSYVQKSDIKTFISVADGPSALCYVLVTPDGEKTSIARMGVGGRYDFDLNYIKKARVFHTSGYELLTNTERTKETIEYMKGIGAEISFDLADPDVIERKKGDIEALLNKIDILFMTEEEASEFNDSPEKALKELSKICNMVALKRGKKGSVVRQKNIQYDIPACKTKLINTAGAGDAYAAGFLYTHINKLGIEECGHKGSYWASKVCGMEESHI